MKKDIIQLCLWIFLILMGIRFGYQEGIKEVHSQVNAYNEFLFSSVNGHKVFYGCYSICRNIQDVTKEQHEKAYKRVSSYKPITKGVSNAKDNPIRRQNPSQTPTDR